MDLSNICKFPSLRQLRFVCANALRERRHRLYASKSLKPKPSLLSSASQSSHRRFNDPWRHRTVFPHWLVRLSSFVCPFLRRNASANSFCDSQSVIVGCYVIIFGAGQPPLIPTYSLPPKNKYPPILTRSDYLATLLLEFQIPPYMSRWAPFLFSFLGRGICKLEGTSLSGHLEENRGLTQRGGAAQSTSSSEPSCSRRQPSAWCPARLSRLSAWAMVYSNTSRRLNRRRI